MVCTQRGVCLAAGLMRLLRPIKIIRIIFGASSQELGWAGACMGSFTQAAAAADQGRGSFKLSIEELSRSSSQPSPAYHQSANYVAAHF